MRRIQAAGPVSARALCLALCLAATAPQASAFRLGALITRARAPKPLQKPDARKAWLDAAVVGPLPNMEGPVWLDAALRLAKRRAASSQTGPSIFGSGPTTAASSQALRASGFWSGLGARARVMRAPRRKALACGAVAARQSARQSARAETGPAAWIRRILAQGRRPPLKLPLKCATAALAALTQALRQPSPAPRVRAAFSRVEL